MPTFAIFSERFVDNEKILVDEEIEDMDQKEDYDELGEHLGFDNKGELEAMNVIYMLKEKQVFILAAGSNKI